MILYISKHTYVLIEIATVIVNMYKNHNYVSSYAYQLSYLKSILILFQSKFLRRKYLFPKNGHLPFSGSTHFGLFEKNLIVFGSFTQIL